MADFFNTLLSICWIVVGVVVLWLVLTWIIRTVEPLITKLLDFLWLPNGIPWVLQDNEKLQLVIDKNLSSTAGWAVLSSSLGLATSGFVLGLIVVIVEFGYRFYVIIESGVLSSVVPDMNFWYFPIGFVLPFLVLPPIYWVEAWKARNSRTIITNMFMVQVEVHPSFIGKDPEISYGDLIPCKEMLAGTDIDRLTKNVGPSKTSALQDLWNRRLYSRTGTGYLIIPSALQFATNILGGVDWCMTTSQIIRSLAIEAEKIKAGLQGNMRAMGTFKVSDLEAMRNRARNGAEVIDLLTVPDPGIWDRRTGQSVAPVATALPTKENPWPSFHQEG